MRFLFETFLRVLSAFCRRNEGSASIEAGLALPMLVTAGLLVADVGMAGTSRMELDQALRAGAQVSMINVTDEDTIAQATLAAFGESEAGDVAADGLCSAESLCVTVRRSCTCGSDGEDAPCNALCTGTNAVPSSFVRIAVNRRYEGIFLPDRTVSSEIRVQTR